LEDDMAKKVAPGLAEFDQLPNAARTALPVVCGLYGASPATVWRRVKAGLIPAPIKEGGSTRWVVGDLRAALSK
jgi:predicted DNA-binding transcriptional regulator AlpA